MSLRLSYVHEAVKEATSVFNKASDIVPTAIGGKLKDAIKLASVTGPRVKAILCEGLLLAALTTEPVTRVEVDSVKAELGNIASGAFPLSLIHKGLHTAAQDFYASRAA